MEGSDNQQDIRNHTGEPSITPPRPKRFKCDLCEQRFTRNSHKKRHYIEIHDDLAKQYICSWCGKAFSRNYQLTRHLSGKTLLCAIKERAFNIELSKIQEPDQEPTSKEGDTPKPQEDSTPNPGNPNFPN